MADAVHSTLRNVRLCTLVMIIPMLVILWMVIDYK